MDYVQLLIGANTLLIAILGVFIRMWIKRIETDISTRTLIVVCDQKHENIEDKIQNLQKERRRVAR
jgi:hypothetical protein